MYGKKKISLPNMVFTLLVLIFSIPLRFLKLCYYFIVENKEDFRTGLECLYFSTYYLMKDLRIEVLNGKIYLNCNTRGKLCRDLLTMNSFITEQNFVNGILALQKEVARFNSIESRAKKEVRVDLISAYNKTGRLLFSPHFGAIERSNTLHATSNVPKILHVNQLIDVAMPSLTLPDAPNPGSVVSSEVSRVEVFPKFKKIPQRELDALKYDHPDKFNLEVVTYQYFKTKDEIFEEIVKNYFKVERNINSIFLKNMRIGNYDFVLLHDKLDDFIIEYKTFYKDKNNWE